MESINKERIKIISKKLEILNPQILNVFDESYKHIGHDGYKTGKGHFKLEIKSNELMNLTRIKAHKKVYEILDEMLENDIHALIIKILK